MCSFFNILSILRTKEKLSLRNTYARWAEISGVEIIKNFHSFFKVHFFLGFYFLFSVRYILLTIAWCLFSGLTFLYVEEKKWFFYIGLQIDGDSDCNVPFSVLNGKYHFWTNLVQKIKIAHTSSNLVWSLIGICVNHRWC